MTATTMVFYYAPTERTMGLVQKIFYFHISSAWVGMVAFVIAAVFGVIYLRHQNLKWDHLAYASVEIGLLFTIMTILTGMIWARPIWNTWWTWDPRLTTVTIMGFIYLAYLLLRRAIEEPERRARFGAVYAILGCLSVPLTFFSVRLLRTIHPVIFTVNNPDMALTPLMLHIICFSLFTFSVIFVALLWHRYRLCILQEQVEALKIGQQDRLNGHREVND